MVRVLVRLGCALCLTVGGALSAHADPADLVKSGSDAVHESRWDEAIAMLSSAVGARELSNADRASAYSNRGYAYLGKGEIGRAIADYGQAIRLAPNDAESHSFRGWAYFLEGNMNQAIADSSAAIKLDPNLVFAYRNRGRAELYSGRLKAAADDFAAAVRLMPSDALGVIWFHVARTRLGADDFDEFKANATKVNHNEWPGTLLDVVTDGSTPKRVLETAREGSGEKTQRERVCDAEVYFGLMQLAAGDKNEARSLFQSAIADCPAGIAEATESSVARIELKALGGRVGRAAAKQSGEERLAARPAAEEARPKPAAEPEVETTSAIPQRSYAYLNQGDVERTISETTRGIRREPKNAWNYQLRAVAHFTIGAMNRAIEDSTTALRLDPSYTVALRVRGLAQLYAGRPKLAADDFAQAVRLSPSDAASVILLHVARTRAQQGDQQEFRTNVARADRRQWPGPLLDVATGASTPEQVGDIAIATPDEKTRGEWVCEAQVYVGLLQLSAGDKELARKLFAAAKADCPAGTSEAAELTIAKLELKRIGDGGSSAVAARPRAGAGAVAEGLPQREEAH